MKTKELYFLQFLVIINSQNRMTDRHPFSSFSYTLFSCRDNQSYIGGIGHGFFNLNKHTKKENKSNWRHLVSISKLPKMLLFGFILTISSFTYSQSNGSTNVPLARMMHDNTITVRTGLHATYNIPCGHFGFATTQEAAAYFQAREVDYIDFVVVDVKNVQMHFDLTNPAVANWTLADWNQALDTRAANVSPRALSNN